MSAGRAPGRVRRGGAGSDLRYGILGRSSPPRFDLAAVVYMRTVGELGFELGAVDDRKRLYQLVLTAMKATRPTIALSSITEVKLDRIVREVADRVERFMAWKELVTDPRILGGEPVFPRSRLAVRQIGGMRRRGAALADLREDYPYLRDQDIAFAVLFERAYPKMGRPRERQAPAR